MKTIGPGRAVFAIGLVRLIVVASAVEKILSNPFGFQYISICGLLSGFWRKLLSGHPFLLVELQIISKAFEILPFEIIWCILFIKRRTRFRFCCIRTKLPN